MDNRRRAPGGAPSPDVSLGQWLTDQLDRRGYDLSQRGGGRARFAEESGVPVATISRFLRDQGGADPRTLGRIAKALGQPVAPLLVRAGILPPSELPNTPAKITQQEALTALGVTSPEDQQAVLAMVRALLAAKGGGNRAP